MGSSNGVYALAGASLPLRVHELSEIYDDTQKKLARHESIDAIQLANRLAIPSFSLLRIVVDLSDQLWLLAYPDSSVNLLSDGTSAAKMLSQVGISGHLQAAAFGFIVSCFVISARGNSARSGRDRSYEWSNSQAKYLR